MHIEAFLDARVDWCNIDIIWDYTQEGVICCLNNSVSPQNIVQTSMIFWLWTQRQILGN